MGTSVHFQQFMGSPLAASTYEGLETVSRDPAEGR